MANENRCVKEAKVRSITGGEGEVVCSCSVCSGNVYFEAYKLKQARYFYLARNKPWWAMLGSNQRPLPCEGSALPLS
jgi:hypothetical protein